MNFDCNILIAYSTIDKNHMQNFLKPLLPLVKFFQYSWVEKKENHPFALFGLLHLYHFSHNHAFEKYLDIVKPYLGNKNHMNVHIDQVWNLKWLPSSLLFFIQKSKEINQENITCVKKKLQNKSENHRILQSLDLVYGITA